MRDKSSVFQLIRVAGTRVLWIFPGSDGSRHNDRPGGDENHPGDLRGAFRAPREALECDAGSDRGNHREIHDAEHEKSGHETGAAESAVDAEMDEVSPRARSV